MPIKIVLVAAFVMTLLAGKIVVTYFGTYRVASKESMPFDECVKKWEHYVRSNYIKTAFSENAILDPSYSGSWIAYEGSAAEVLFEHPVMLEDNPKLKLLHDLNELEVIFDRLHEIRIKASSDSNLRDAAMNLGYFKPIFKTRRKFAQGEEIPASISADGINNFLIPTKTK